MFIRLFRLFFFSCSYSHSYSLEVIIIVIQSMSSGTNMFGALLRDCCIPQLMAWAEIVISGPKHVNASKHTVFTRV